MIKLQVMVTSNCYDNTLLNSVYVVNAIKIFH